MVRQPVGSFFVAAEVAMSHTTTVPFSSFDASVFPSGEIASEHANIASSVSVTVSWPDARSKMRTVLSLAVATLAPSGKNATASMPSTLSGSPSFASSFPAATSQTRSILSSPPDASFLPSFENATALTSLVWPARALTCPVATSTSWIASYPADAIVLPSGDHASGFVPPRTPLMARSSLTPIVQIKICGDRFSANATDLPSGDQATLLIVQGISGGGPSSWRTLPLRGSKTRIVSLSVVRTEAPSGAQATRVRANGERKRFVPSRARAPAGKGSPDASFPARATRAMESASTSAPTDRRIGPHPLEGF
jgi:hypothetical protein